MDDERDFERRVTDELVDAAGPVHHIDDLEVYAAVLRRMTEPRRPLRVLVGATRFAVAGLVVLAFGGLLVAGIVATRTSDAGPLAGAGGRAEPVEFSARLTGGPCTNVRSTEFSDGLTRILEADNGRFCRPVVVEPFTDPRLQGEVFGWRNTYRYSFGPTIVHAGFSIVDDVGAWQQIPGLALEFGDRTTSSDTVALIGSGAYEGLLAIVEIDFERDGSSWRGWIVEGGLPPTPDPPDEARAR